MLQMSTLGTIHEDSPYLLKIEITDIIKEQKNILIKQIQKKKYLRLMNAIFNFKT